ncbi:MAG: tetratricopeptide repeat protein [Acidobacteriota bacterium]|nr:tetratricopeptide repeat protein [Blastocatellia bacterium]MDW8239255.1 tetratricopeptide repeat protein [Acidobacteriota bacterium]
MSGRGWRAVAASVLISLVGVTISSILWQQRSRSTVESVSVRPARRSWADEQISQAEAKLRTLPGEANFYVELATGFMNKARESGDGSYYARAEAACQKAFQLDPDNYGALRLVAWIYGGQHRFVQAREAARRALARDPRDPWNYGTLGDALVELGEYPAAAEAFQKMIDLRPDTASYSRAAYIRELYGDPEGAIEAMNMALNAAGSRDSEQQVWCRSQLGNLFFNIGRIHEAGAHYETALKIFPEYHYALTGLARVRVAEQRYGEAVELYRTSLARVPTHEAAVGLGDLLTHLGRNGEASEAFRLLDVIEQINRANNIEPEPYMALFYADHDRNLDEALRIAEHAAQQSKNVRVMDTLAWVLYKKGRYREALAASRQALRLGMKEALFYYHAGMIHAKLGHAKQAREALRQALQINPSFHPRHAAQARAMLNALGD